MDRIKFAILAEASIRAAIVSRIEVLERETAAQLLRGVTSAAEYRTINNIMATQHAEARVYAEPPLTEP